MSNIERAVEEARKRLRAAPEDCRCDECLPYRMLLAYADAPVVGYMYQTPHGHVVTKTMTSGDSIPLIARPEDTK